MRNVQITLDGLSIKYAFLKGVKESFFESVVNNIESVSDILSITVRINTNKFNSNQYHQIIVVSHIKDIELQPLCCLNIYSSVVQNN